VLPRILREKQDDGPRILREKQDDGREQNVPGREQESKTSPPTIEGKARPTASTPTVPRVPSLTPP
jgi:hypothetical protein